MLLVLLLGRDVMSGWKCIEIGEVAGDVGCLATFVAFHGSHGVRSVGENAMSRRNWELYARKATEEAEKME